MSKDEMLMEEIHYLEFYMLKEYYIISSILDEQPTLSKSDKQQCKTRLIETRGYFGQLHAAVTDKHTSGGCDEIISCLWEMCNSSTILSKTVFSKQLTRDCYIENRNLLIARATNAFDLCKQMESCYQ